MGFGLLFNMVVNKKMCQKLVYFYVTFPFKTFCTYSSIFNDILGEGVENILCFSQFCASIVGKPTSTYDALPRLFDVDPFT